MAGEHKGNNWKKRTIEQVGWQNGNYWKKRSTEYNRKKKRTLIERTGWLNKAEGQKENY